jgi:ABC-type polar amino acid transport system ATPase subunit
MVVKTSTMMLITHSLASARVERRRMVFLDKLSLGPSPQATFRARTSVARTQS